MARRAGLNRGAAGGRLRARAALATLALGAYLLTLGYVAVVPPGEAPDEPAHLYIVDRLAASGRWPRATAAEPLAYEAHQPPLDYALMAAAGRALGLAPVGYPFVPDPGFDFALAGSRAFRPAAGSPAAHRRLLGLRALHALWAPLTVLLAAALAGAARPGGDAVARLLPVVLIAGAPQALFAFATVSNDGAAIALSTATLLALTRSLDDGAAAKRWASAAGALAGLALWSKGTALFLLVPVAYLAVRLARAPDRRARLARLLLPLGAAGSALLAWHLVRHGALWPDLPQQAGHEPRAALVRLLGEPSWLLGLWRSFWAKFGWFNLPLPAPFYLLFLPATALAGWGALVALGSSGVGEATAGPAAPRARLALAAGAANLALLAGFMVLVAWQPQGRLLLPASGALVVLAACGWGELERRWTSARTRRWLAAGAALAAAAAHLFSLWWIARAYAPR